MFSNAFKKGVEACAVTSYARGGPVPAFGPRRKLGPVRVVMANKPEQEQAACMAVQVAFILKKETCPLWLQPWGGVYSGMVLEVGDQGKVQAGLPDLIQQARGTRPTVVVGHSEPEGQAPGTVVAPQKQPGRDRERSSSMGGDSELTRSLAWYFDMYQAVSSLAVRQEFVCSLANGTIDMAFASDVYKSVYMLNCEAMGLPKPDSDADFDMAVEWRVAGTDGDKSYVRFHVKMTLRCSDEGYDQLKETLARRYQKAVEQGKSHQKAAGKAKSQGKHSARRPEINAYVTNAMVLAQEMGRVGRRGQPRSV